MRTSYCTSTLNSQTTAAMLTPQRPRGQAGFTLMEVIVVIAIMGIVMGAAMPLVTVFIDQQRRDEVRSELASLSTALSAYYEEHGAFPKSLDAPEFLGVFLTPGISGTAILDGWGTDGAYVYQASRSPDVVTVTSRGMNGTFERGGGDDFRVRVPGGPPGNARTRARIRLIVASLVKYVEGGGKLSGDWRVDVVRIGLGAPYDRDGFGTRLRVNPRTLHVESAGADRRFGTKDDLGS